jgi:integrase
MSQSQTQHTLGHTNCPACLSLGAMSILSGSQPFSDACLVWLENHANYIKPRTLKTYRQYADRLSEFFQNLPLDQFHVGNLRAYQRWRMEKACAAVTNAEIRSILIPILREVNCWKKIEDVFRPLPEPKKKVRQVMSPDQERQFLCVALDTSNPCRLVAGHCLIIMVNTSMGFGEIRHLKREDVVLNEDIPYVTVNEGTKNEFRIRTIPLNWVAVRSMKWILRRWEDLGGSRPEEYILPHRGKRSGQERQSKAHRRAPADFTRPMDSIYRAAKLILRDAGMPTFVPYDTRSTAITKVLSDPNVSDQMAEEIIGHANTFTKRRYSRQRLEKKAVAMERLCLDEKPSSKLLLFQGGRK